MIHLVREKFEIYAVQKSKNHLKLFTIVEKKLKISLNVTTHLKLSTMVGGNFETNEFQCLKIINYPLSLEKILKVTKFKCLEIIFYYPP